MRQQIRHGHLPKDLFLSDRLVFINQVVNSTVYRPETALSHMHFHDFVELSLVVEGRGYHRTLHECSPCAPGDVYVIDEGAPHAYYIREEGEELVLRNFILDPKDILDGDLAVPDHPRYCCGLFREDPMVSHAFLSPDCVREAIRIMDRIDKEQTRKQMEWEVSVKAHLLDMLVMCSRRLVSETNGDSKPLSKLRDRQIAASVMYTVLKQYQDPDMTLERIAEEAFLSKSHLSFVFKQVTGIHFSEYVKNVRLEEACRLLDETDMTNEEICHACGFRDITSFYRSFQTHMSMTPLAYRRNRTNK